MTPGLKAKTANPSPSKPSSPVEGNQDLERWKFAPLVLGDLVFAHLSECPGTGPARRMHNHTLSGNAAERNQELAID
jgi:hypothetical protein